MFGRIGIAVRFFLTGFVLGLLTAPRSGRATRNLIVRQMERMLQGAGISLQRAEQEIGEPYATEALGSVPPAEERPAA